VQIQWHTDIQAVNIVAATPTDRKARAAQAKTLSTEAVGTTRKHQKAIARPKVDARIAKAE